MINFVGKSYFAELAAQDPKDICKKALCEYDDVNRSYIISVWNDKYIVYPHEHKIDCISKAISKPHEYFYLFIIYYLLKAKEIKVYNEWISEKDISGGPTFFRGPHEIPANLISELFGNNIEEFKNKCMQLSGIDIKMADAAFSFNVAPRIPVAVLYWTGDDDFSPEAKILFDKTITRHLTPDIIFVLAVEVCARIGRP